MSERDTCTEIVQCKHVRGAFACILEQPISARFESYFARSRFLLSHPLPPPPFFCPRTAKTRSGDEIIKSYQVCGAAKPGKVELNSTFPAPGTSCRRSYQMAEQNISIKNRTTAAVPQCYHRFDLRQLLGSYGWKPGSINT